MCFIPGLHISHLPVYSDCPVVVSAVTVVFASSM